MADAEDRPNAFPFARTALLPRTMSHFRFITALLRIIAVYLLIAGLGSVPYIFWSLWQMMEVGRFDDLGGVPPWLLLLEPLLHLGPAVVLFVAAPWVAKLCLGRDAQTTVQPPPPIDSVMVFVVGFGVAAYALLEAVDILVHPLLELRKPGHLRDGKLMDVPTFVHGFIVLVIAVAGLWVMLFFQRVHAWIHRRSHSAPSQPQIPS